MSEVFSGVLLGGRPGTVTVSNDAIVFEGKISKSAFELEFIKEDVVKPATSTLELTLEVDGITDTLSFQMTSLSEVVRLRRALADKLKQSEGQESNNTDNNNEEAKPSPPSTTPGAVSVRSRPSNQKEMADSSARSRTEMVDSSARSTTSRPGAVSVNGNSDAGTMKARRNRTAISLPPPDEIKNKKKKKQTNSETTSTSEPGVLVSRNSMQVSQNGDKPPVQNISSSDESGEISEFGEDNMDQSNHDGGINYRRQGTDESGGMDMSASQNSNANRQQEIATKGSTEHRNSINSSMHSNSSNQSGTRRSSARRSTFRGLRASNSMSDNSRGSHVQARSSRREEPITSSKEGQETPRASVKENKRHEKEETPVNDKENEKQDYDEAVRLKEEYALKKIQESSAEMHRSEALSLKSVEEGAATPLDATYNTLVEARVVEESEEFVRPSAVASEVDLEAEKTKRSRFLCRIGIGCCLIIVAVIVVAVLAATNVIGGGDDETAYAYVPPPTLTPEERFALIQERISNVVMDGSVMENPDSPQRKALEWLANKDTFQQNPMESDETLQERLEQRYILALFYFIMNDASRWQYCKPPETGEAPACIHPTLESYAKEGIYYDQKMTEPAFRWLSEADECTWAGVRCKDHIHVSKLLLGGYKLAGTLPVEVGYLRSLEVLDLQQNSLVGSLPAEWGTLERNNAGLTTIRLDGNQLSGPIPEEWCQFNEASMKDFILTDNFLTGTIPSCLSKFSQLEHLNVMKNSLTGTIPSDFSVILHLETFHVAQNNLEGSMPDELCNLMRYEMVEASTDCADETAENYVACECCTSCWPQSETPGEG